MKRAKSEQTSTPEISTKSHFRSGGNQRDESQSSVDEVKVEAMIEPSNKDDGDKDIPKENKLHRKESISESNESCDRENKANNSSKGEDGGNNFKGIKTDKDSTKCEKNLTRITANGCSEMVKVKTEKDRVQGKKKRSGFHDFFCKKYQISPQKCYFLC